MIDQGIVAPLLAAVTLAGLASNSIALYAVCRNKSVLAAIMLSKIHLHNTLGVLCGVLALANIGASLVLLLWSACGPYLVDEQTLIGTQGKIVGQLAVCFLDLKVYAHLGVSVNRLFSLVQPLVYYSLESSVGVTSLFVAFPVFFAILQVSPLFWTDDCYFIYYKNIGVWGYDETPCNDFYAFYIDFLISFIIFCGIVLLDSCAVFAIRQAIPCSKTTYINPIHFKALKSIAQYDESSKAKRRIQIGFFVQSVCQMALSIIIYISFVFISSCAKSDWALFGSTTFAWALLHALDGIIMVSFQSRRMFKRSRVVVFRGGSTSAPTGSTLTWMGKYRAETAQ